MIQPTFAKRLLTQPIQLGKLKINNLFIKWFCKQKHNYKYTYLHYNRNLYIKITSIGWMMMSNNPIYPKSLYLVMLVIHKRGKGHGTNQINMIKRFCEETNTSLSLMPIPMKHTDDRLESFYSNLGLTKQGRFFTYEVEKTKKEIKFKAMLNLELTEI